MSYATTTTLTLALAAALLSACDHKPSDPPKPQSSTVAAAPSSTQSIPAGITSDPSVPPASQVMSEPPAATAGQDTAAARPNEALRKEEESKTMPKALHGNNHSSTALDGAQKQQQ